ncbi:MAG: cupin domain-containing protein [Pseudomonadota bacterium]
MKLLWTIMLLLGLGFAAQADWLGPEAKSGDRYAARDLEKILAANPLGENEAFKVTPLFENPRSKHVLVQVRDREPAHVHTDSDITVWLLRGGGVMHVGGKEHPVKVGDVIHVPRDVVHYYLNRGPEAGAALVVYSPAPGPDDRVLIRTK